MTDERAILATYSDFRLVKSRKVLQIVMEVPIEQATDALNKLGFPDPSGSVWCGIAILDKKATNGGRGSTDEQRSSNATDAGSTPVGPAKPRRPFHELSNREQAVLLCKDKNFQQYVSAKDEAEARKRVLDDCEVNSRKELDSGHHPVANWKRLREGFQSYLTTLQHADTFR